MISRNPLLEPHRPELEDAMQATQAKIEGHEEIPFMNIDETDFSELTLGQRIRHLEVEGYVVLPDVLDPEFMQRIRKQMADAPMQTKDYSDAQTYFLEPQWHSRAMAELIANPPMIEFLEVLMGPDIVFTRGFFSRTLAGSPPISLHTDGQPFGSSIFGFEGSSPRLLRVLYYLDDLTPDRAPFRLLPRSHLSFHAEANPYVRYKWHPDEIADRGVWPNACRMASGVLAVAYGRTGDWLAFSIDEGHHWIGHFCYYHGPQSLDGCTHSWVQEVAPDTLLVAYSRTDLRDPCQSEILATYFYVRREH